MATVRLQGNGAPRLGAKGTLLWAAQWALAAAFGVIAVAMIVLPFSRLEGFMPWVGSTYQPVVRLLGWVQLACVFGLAAPAVLRPRSALVPASAFTLACLMMLAVIVHLAEGHYAMTPLFLLLDALALVVLWGRTPPERFLPGEDGR